MAQLATAWLLSKDTVSAPIVGLNSEERIKEMVEAVHIELTEEEIKNLEERYIPRSILGHS